ncbi:hypothetical protein UB51_17875 [Paenibacillus sp. IHBB 10380]|nr:hypothetical protein UB51_17875 [Paenibacillus sp. IHBB 10380]
MANASLLVVSVAIGLIPPLYFKTTYRRTILTVRKLSSIRNQRKQALQESQKQMNEEPQEVEEYI